MFKSNFVNHTWASPPQEAIRSSRCVCVPTCACFRCRQTIPSSESPRPTSPLDPCTAPLPAPRAAPLRPSPLYVPLRSHSDRPAPRLHHVPPLRPAFVALSHLRRPPLPCPNRCSSPLVAVGIDDFMFDNLLMPAAIHDLFERERETTGKGESCTTGHPNAPNGVQFACVVSCSATRLCFRIAKDT